MASEWEEVSLGDVSDLLTGLPFASDCYIEEPKATRLLRGDNIAQGKLRWDGVKRWADTSAANLAPYWLSAGDIVLAMDRPWIDAGLKYAAVGLSDLPSLLVQRVARLRGTARLSTRFLKFIIGSRAFTEHILAVQTGTGVPHISSRQIKSFRFRLPPLDIQKKIGHILGTLDAKNDLNLRISQTLDMMSRALFQSCFVDFGPVRAKAEERATGLSPEATDFLPAKFESSKLGPIPSGWRLAGLDEIGTFLNGLALQKYPAGPDGSLPAIKIAQLRSGNTANADRVSKDVPVAYRVQDGDILFSWSGSLECVVWASGPGALNQHLFKVTSDQYPKWFLLGWIEHHLPSFRRIAAAKATTMGHIQRHHLREAMVVLPPRSFVNAASAQFDTLFNASITAKLQCRTISSLRDTLLPKLLSGELRVHDVEAIGQ